MVNRYQVRTQTGIIYGNILELLYNNGKLSVLIKSSRMSTQDIQYHDQIRKNIPKDLFSCAIGRIHTD